MRHAKAAAGVVACES